MNTTREIEPPQLNRCLAFIQELRARNISFSLGAVRADAVLVALAVPGERWEVEFLENGSVDVEKFRSTGEIGDVSALNTLFDGTFD